MILAVGLPFSDYSREKKALMEYYDQKPFLKYEYNGIKFTIADGIPEREEYMKEVLPDLEQEKLFQQELLEIVVDVSEYLLPSA